jgi:uncharacterized protein YqfB (UPF0267 family)
MADYISTLPIDLILYIFDWLDGASLMLFSSTNRAYFGLIWSRLGIQKRILSTRQAISTAICYTVGPVFNLVKAHIDAEIALFEIMKQKNCIDRFSITIREKEDSNYQWSQHIAFNLFNERVYDNYRSQWALFEAIKANHGQLGHQRLVEAFRELIRRQCDQTMMNEFILYFGH